MIGLFFLGVGVTFLGFFIAWCVVNKIRTFNDKLPNKVKFGLAFVKAQKLKAKDGSNFSISTCLIQLEKYHNRYFKLTGGTKEEFLEALIECYCYRLRPKKKHISNKILD